MPKKKESYEDILEKLQQIVTDMENEEISLEKSMKNYEAGIKLSNKLLKMLNEAEAKVKIISDNKEKIFSEEDV